MSNFLIYFYACSEQHDVIGHYVSQSLFPTANGLVNEASSGNSTQDFAHAFMQKLFFLLSFFGPRGRFPSLPRDFTVYTVTRLSSEFFTVRDAGPLSRQSGALPMSHHISKITKLVTWLIHHVNKMVVMEYTQHRAQRAHWLQPELWIRIRIGSLSRSLVDQDPYPNMQIQDKIERQA